MSKYAIVKITDRTPSNLEYGDYRGLVVLNDDEESTTYGQALADNGEYVHPSDLDAARAWIASQEGVAVESVRLGDQTNDDLYERVWPVTIES